MTGALQGLKVVEIADEISGPYCGKLLADLGAKVTKIESAQGDPLRRWGPFPGGEPHPDRSGLFEYLNAAKRLVTVDDDTKRQLIADADVLIDATDTPLSKPGPVVVHVSNFVRRSPFRDRPATPLTMQAASGRVSARDPDRPPVQAGRASPYTSPAPTPRSAR